MPLVRQRGYPAASRIAVAGRLAAVRQPTLILAGSDDPIVPLANAKIMNRLLPNSALHVHDGGHVELIANAAEQARVIEEFRRKA